jgi:hypothetical protein
MGREIFAQAAVGNVAAKTLASCRGEANFAPVMGVTTPNVKNRTLTIWFNERVGLIWSDRVNLRNLWVCCCCWFRRCSRTGRAAVGAVFSDD